MNAEQLKHHGVRLKKPIDPVIMVCDAVTGRVNAGALIRLNDAFGVQQLFFYKKNIESGRLKKTARSSEKHVTILQRDSSLSVLKEFRKKGFKRVGLEITPTSQALQN